jgi:thiamine-phosphate pyrophosphorylase
VAAIGGLTIERAASVLDAGASSLAVISDLFSDPDDVPARLRAWVRVTAAHRPAVRDRHV